jgi:hypothetical protein
MLKSAGITAAIELLSVAGSYMVLAWYIGNAHG